MNNNIRQMIDKIKSLGNNINENIDNKRIKYIISNDEDYTKITAYIDNVKIGIIVFVSLYDSYTYEFDDVFDEDTFNKLYPDDTIIKIEHLEIYDNYKNNVIGFKLMKYGMDYMKNQGYKQFYLNASPIGSTGLNTTDLVEFYKKFGFKILKNQGHNVLMGTVK